MRSAGAGSRARSREIGYGEAMQEMHGVLQRGAEFWRKAETEEAEDGNMAAAAAFGSIAAWVERRADYAYAAFELHAAYGGRFAADVEWRDMAEREGYVPRGPRELPRRSQCESN